MTKQFLLGAVMFVFALISKASSSTDSLLPAIKDTLIDVGGYKLHFVITNAGALTILLEAGGGADASQWDSIQQKLATETKATIISYDRAGFGKSELPNTPYDIKKEVQDLHKCLRSLGVVKLVLVGHSYGALVIQGYQFMYPENIAAIILADPNNVTFVDSIGLKILMRIPFDTTKTLSIAQRADVRQTIAFNRTVETLREMPFSKKIPVTVISAGNDWWPFPLWNRWWKNSHQSIVNTVENRTLLIAEGSGHNIPKEQPNILAHAIIKVLKKIAE
jgi:pimeloyl-ACP methyl ester carboxylesterase